MNNCDSLTSSSKKEEGCLDFHWKALLDLRYLKSPKNTMKNYYFSARRIAVVILNSLWSTCFSRNFLAKLEFLAGCSTQIIRLSCILDVTLILYLFCLLCNLENFISLNSRNAWWSSLELSHNRGIFNMGLYTWCWSNGWVLIIHYDKHGWIVIKRLVLIDTTAIKLVFALHREKIDKWE